MRKALVAALALLVVLAVGGTVLANHLVGQRIASGVQQQLGLPQRPAVHVADPLVLVHAAQGRIPTLRADIAVPASSGVAATATLMLHDVRFPRSLLLGGHGTVTVGSGTATVQISQAALQQLAAQRFPEADLTVQVEPDGVHVRVAESVLGIDVGGDVTIQVQPAAGGVRLVATSVNLPAPVSGVVREAFGSGIHVALPLPPGATVTSIETGTGTLTVRASFGQLELRT